MAHRYPPARLRSRLAGNQGAVIVAAALLVGALYGRRARTLARRGRGMPLWRQLSFYLGIAIVVAALISPLDTIGEEHVFYAHMLQHIAIGEVAPLFVLVGLSGPLLRPLLAPASVQRLRFLLNPLVALPLWALNLYGWHIPAFYEAALEHPPLHAVEHACFFTAGLLMWGALLEPLPGPSWFGSAQKAGYVLVVRALGCAILGNIFIWAGTPFYRLYAAGERAWGIAPLTDQQVGGAIMFIWGALITVSLFSWMFLRWFREAELRQSLLEDGAEARVATRAARYGRRPPARPAPPPSP
ncbi:MAG TPA: cytochrome c oxidase assembly protein [Solirubrobacterales bacterium]|nr:cytochrome c oxidase assembly protein [Solirubrobacterales bacterium]